MTTLLDCIVYELDAIFCNAKSAWELKGMIDQFFSNGPVPGPAVNVKDRGEAEISGVVCFKTSEGWQFFGNCPQLAELFQNDPMGSMARLMMKGTL